MGIHSTLLLECVQLAGLGVPAVLVHPYVLTAFLNTISLVDHVWHALLPAPPVPVQPHVFPASRGTTSALRIPVSLAML